MDPTHKEINTCNSGDVRMVRSSSFAYYYYYYYDVLFFLCVVV